MAMKPDEKFGRTRRHEILMTSSSERHERCIMPSHQIRRPLVEIGALRDSGPLGFPVTASPWDKRHLFVERVRNNGTGYQQNADRRCREFDRKFHGSFLLRLLAVRLIALPETDHNIFRHGWVLEQVSIPFRICFFAGMICLFHSNPFLPV